MDEGSVCVANITRAGRTRRAVLGVVVLGATAAAYFMFVRGRPLEPWAILAVAPIAFGWLCVTQAAANT
jgi:hypothetical protein